MVYELVQFLARFNSIGHKCFFPLPVGVPHQFWCMISFIVGNKVYVRYKGYPKVYVIRVMRNAL